MLHQMQEWSFDHDSNQGITAFHLIAPGGALLLIDKNLGSRPRQFAQFNDIPVAHTDAAV